MNHTSSSDYSVTESEKSQISLPSTNTSDDHSDFLEQMKKDQLANIAKLDLLNCETLLEIYRFQHAKHVAESQKIDHEIFASKLSAETAARDARLVLQKADAEYNNALTDFRLAEAKAKAAYIKLQLTGIQAVDAAMRNRDAILGAKSALADLRIVREDADAKQEEAEECVKRSEEWVKALEGRMRDLTLAKLLGELDVQMKDGAV